MKIELTKKQIQMLIEIVDKQITKSFTHNEEFVIFKNWYEIMYKLNKTYNNNFEINDNKSEEQNKGN